MTNYSIVSTIGRRSEIIPLYALFADPPDAADILIRKHDGWDCGLRYRFYRNERRSKLHSS